ncbi:MAG: hypothetical protein KKB51_24615 [Candidatus Riflebacteria bacterium]|nr:hypothetical protein [Candidatus Riflebacteria bacterium]
MLLPLIDNSDEEFAACLDSLEGNEVPRRRHAMVALERLGGTRALQVATALTSDVDPVVANLARRICSVLGKKGLMLRRYLRTQHLVQTVSIRGFYQLLDEVVFVIRRNLAGIAIDSFLFSIPKLLMVTVFFVSPFFAPFFDLVHEVWLVSLLIFVYQIFWRPLVWHSTGLAFLAGFPENACRRQARKAGGWRLYNSLLKVGLIEAILYSLMLSMAYSLYFSSGKFGFPLLVTFTVWLLIWTLSVRAPSAVIFSSSVKAESVWLFDCGSNFWLSMKLGMVLILLYMIVFGSAVSSLWMFGLDNWFSVPHVFSCGFFIAADVLIDPFVVGYRLLLARLNMDPK